MDAFLFYIDDWLSSTKIAAMDAHEERGYLRLLLFAAKQEDCGIPNDAATLSRISMLGGKWRKAAPKIRECFFESEGRLYNERLLREFERQTAYIESKRNAGAEGAKKRWQRNGTPNGRPIVLPSKNDGKNMAEGMQTPNHRSPVASLSDANSASDQTDGPPNDAARAATVRSWLLDYMRPFGLDWPDPDDIIVLKILQAIDDQPIEKLQDFLLYQYGQGKRPGKSWMWFASIVETHFAGIRRRANGE